MKRGYTYKRELRFTLFCLCILFSSLQLKAQVIKTAFTSRLMTDSLLASTNKDFLYNNLTLANTTSDKITITVSITAPKGWQLITQGLANITLNGSENTIIPIRLLPQGNNNDASWQQVKIEYHLGNSAETRYDYFYVKVKEFNKFRTSLPNANIVMTSYKRHLQVPVYIKNAGNTVSTYSVAYQNEFLHLNDKVKITLEPGVDSVHRLPITLTESEYSMLTKEEVRVIVQDSADLFNLSQIISKVGYSLKQHSTAYQEMPIQLESGATYQGGSPVQYYGALYGSVDLTPEDKMAIEYRSKTLSVGQTVDNQLLRMYYTGKHWNAKAGNISELNDFAIDGYGGKIGYTWKEHNLIDVFAMVKSRVGNSKVFGAHMQYMLNDNMKLRETYTSSFDYTNKVNGHVVSQKVDIAFAENARLGVTTGVGMEESKAKLSGASTSMLMGSSLGYDFQWLTKAFSLQSVVNYNSDNYAGIYKGQRLQSHDARLLYKKVFVGAFYEYNFRKQNYFFDSLLLTNVFNLRTDNYGIRTGWNTKLSNITLAAGNQKQMQSGENTEQVNYDYVSLGTSLFINKDIFFNSTTSLGYNSVVGGNASDKAMIFSSQGTVQVYKLGASFRYDKGPYYYHEYLAYLKNKSEIQRMFISPYVDLSLMKKAVNVRAQYNYSLTLPSKTTTSNALLNLTYTNVKKGYDCQLSGIMPFKGGLTQAYFNASLRVRLNAPFLPIRKYYNVRVQMFKDVNSNGEMDGDEEPVAGQTLALNDQMFVSNEKGIIQLKNASKGDYKLDFGYTSKLRGWAPSNGVRQETKVQGNETVKVPYKVSRVLQGSLTLQVDSTSHLKFSVANIKVVAKDESGIEYSTLTEENGEFYINLPAGNYIVSLSEAAFDENFRPTEMSQTADMVSNNVKTLHFEIKQKKRTMNIKKK